MFQQDTIFVWHIFLRIWHTCARVCAIYAPCFESHGPHVDHFLNTELDIFSKITIQGFMQYVVYQLFMLTIRVTCDICTCVQFPVIKILEKKHLLRISRKCLEGFSLQSYVCLQARIRFHKQQYFSFSGQTLKEVCQVFRSRTMGHFHYVLTLC